ncbi:uncharacterized protein LOC143891833 [Tasmannia lanceolata]|uniref:uncharacterized protein LOC143891833 n=1 Tax=Tasmannia lanceolata TaxID=3420 RepID=UPI004063C11A
MAESVAMLARIEKLNNTNCIYCKSCLESYLQGQDLWEIVNGNNTETPEEGADTLRKWKIRAGKALYVLKASIQKELIEHIKDAKTPKEAWEALSSLFSQANDARLQFLENEMGSLTQGNLYVSDYFMKARNLCSEISQLDEESKISESRMRRLIIRGLRLEFSGFITAIRGWPMQPFPLELENLLINQEMLARQMAGLSVKESEEALAVNSKRKRNCRTRIETDDENVVIESKDKEEDDIGEWDMHASFACDVAVEETAMEFDFEGEISFALNVAESPVVKIYAVAKYDGNHAVVTADNSIHAVKNVGDVTVTSWCGEENSILKYVYHVPGLTKNLVSVAQITSAGKYVLFGHDDVKVFEKVDVSGNPIMRGKRMETMYVLSAGTTYVDKARRNETPELWHVRLAHVAYDKLKIMVERNLVRGLPLLENGGDTVCAGCQFGKAHRQPISRSEFHSKRPLELVHSDVCGPMKQKSEKSEVFEKIKDFRAHVEAETGFKIGCLRTDNGA